MSVLVLRGVPPIFREGGSSKFLGGVPPNFREEGSSKFSGGVLQFFRGGSPPEYSQRSAGTHPTGMHSCIENVSAKDISDIDINTKKILVLTNTGYNKQSPLHLWTAVSKT